MESAATGSAKKPKMRREYSGEDLLKGNSQAINKDMLRTVNRFLKKQKKGTIDVWWLFDDGGKEPVAVRSCVGYCQTMHLS